MLKVVSVSKVQIIKRCLEGRQIGDRGSGWKVEDSKIGMVLG